MFDIDKEDTTAQLVAAYKTIIAMRAEILKAKAAGLNDQILFAADLSQYMAQSLSLDGGFSDRPNFDEVIDQSSQWIDAIQLRLNKTVLSSCAL